MLQCFMAYLKFHQALNWRLAFLVIFFCLALLAVAGRVFELAIIQHRSYIVEAERQHKFSESLPPERGKIFFQDKNGELHPAALNKNFITFIASPKDIANPREAAQLIAGRLKLDPVQIEAKLGKANDAYEIIAKNISDEDAEFIQKLGISGLTLHRDSRRTYPVTTLGAGILGFVSFDGIVERGEYGIEKQYNKMLAGEVGFFEGERSASGYWAEIGMRILRPPVNGRDIILTADRNIQFKLEETLAKLLKRWHGESVSAVILEPSTGRILAMAALPTFNPGDYSKEKDYSVFRMPIIDSQFELGSVFKPITMAGGLNEGVVREDSTYRDAGFIKFDSYTIKNFDGRSYGVQTMTQVLEKSLNTGAVYVEQMLGKEQFLDYVKRFGFGEKTEIDFPGEVSGNIVNLRSKRDLEFATASFGQGIAVTPLQMSAAMAAIANSGILMRPYIVEKIVDEAGNENNFLPKPRGEVVKKETAEVLTKMLVSAVRNGFENRAGVKGYFVAGKTGTAQIPLLDRRGYSDEVIHTFVGYAPAFKPKFLILLQLNKPEGNRFAANTLTPVFHDLAEFILNYYEIPPDEK